MRQNMNTPKTEKSVSSEIDWFYLWIFKNILEKKKYKKDKSGFRGKKLLKT